MNSTSFVVTRDENGDLFALNTAHIKTISYHANELIIELTEHDRITYDGDEALELLEQLLPDVPESDNNRDRAMVTNSGSARPLTADASPISADPAPPAPPAVRVFGAPAARANRVQIVDQPTCAVCGKPLKKRHGAKTCSDTCRKRYSRRRDEMQKAYMTAKSAIDAMLKYARHADLRDEVYVYAGALGQQIDAARRLLDDLDAVPAANRDAVLVTDSGSARASKRAPAAGRADRADELRE